MPDRIVSLLPSATETLFELGLGEQVVGVSHECDEPPEVRRLPRVQRTVVDPEEPPAKIDARVKGQKREGLPLFEVDQQALRDLSPDVVITQDTCDVCAVRPEDVQEAVTYWPEAERPRVVTVHAHDLEGVFRDVMSLGKELGAGKQAEDLVRLARERLKVVEESVEGAERPRVLVLDWLDPVMVAGHWVPQMVEAAGGLPRIVGRREPSRYAGWDELVEAVPDVVVLAPCGNDLERVEREAEIVERGAGWDELPAVREGRVFAVDANRYFSRGGLRLVDGVEMLAHAFHPVRVELKGSLSKGIERLKGVAGGVRAG